MFDKIRNLLTDKAPVPVTAIEPVIVMDKAPVPVKVNDGGTFFNGLSGMGGDADKSNQSYWGPNYIYWNYALLENTYVNSWAAKKMIEIPVKDMLMKPRILIDLKSSVESNIDEIYQEIDIETKITEAMFSARAYGTALMVIVSADGRMDTPLNIDSLSVNDLKNILVVDRFMASVVSRTTDISSPNFQKPEFYNIVFRFTASVKVHYSRIIRIDGVSALGTNLWQSYSIDWGISEIIPVWTTITAEEGMATNIDQLFQEYSVPVYKAKGIAESLAGEIDARTNIANLASRVNLMKSNFRMLYCDSESEINRLDVNFRGIPELMDKMSTRVAAASDIPYTRFFSQSPAGMNATGDSDMNNYAIMVSAMQRKKLRPVQAFLDKLIAKSIGYKGTIKFEYPSLVDISSNEQAVAYYNRAQGDQIYANLGAVTEDEIRQNLSNSDAFDADLSQPIENDPPSDDALNMLAQKINANQNAMTQQIQPPPASQTVANKGLASQSQVNANAKA